MSELDYIILLSRLAERFPEIQWSLRKGFRKKENILTVFNGEEFVNLDFISENEINNDLVIHAFTYFETKERLHKFNVWVFTCKSLNEIAIKVTKSNNSYQKLLYIQDNEEIVFSLLNEWLIHKDELSCKLL